MLKENTISVLYIISIKTQKVSCNFVDKEVWNKCSKQELLCQVRVQKGEEKESYVLRGCSSNWLWLPLVSSSSSWPSTTTKRFRPWTSSSPRTLLWRKCQKYFQTLLGQTNSIVTPTHPFALFFPTLCCELETIFGSGKVRQWNYCQGRLEVHPWQFLQTLGSSLG